MKEKLEIEKSKKIKIIIITSTIYVLMIIEFICLFLNFQTVYTVASLVSFIIALIGVVLLVKSKEEIIEEKSKFYFYLLAISIVISVLFNVFVK